MNPTEPALALYPLVLPASWPPIPAALDEVTTLFERASALHQKGDHERASEMFNAAAKHLLDAASPDGPDLGGARTACYLNAVIAALAADPGQVVPVLEWVRENDAQCYGPVSDAVGRFAPHRASPT